jgi:hypothetical protein
MLERILNVWREEMSLINKKPWMTRLQSGDFQIRHYKGFLLETYHHAGLNPQIQAFATMFFKDNPREMIGMFYKHATSEIAHDLLALNDLGALGENMEKLKQTRPLPSTAAFNAFALMQIQLVNPISYLGYLFHLEFLPTQQGRGHIERLMSLGVPETALTFLEEHATVDIGHNKMMERYIKYFVTDEKTFSDVAYALKCSCHLHYNMLAGAFENGDAIFA